jgi:radical SAM superfamily enzyme YgiQ (UPF0313 family)
MNIKKSVDEYEKLINYYKVKEIFDDSGVWYRGNDARNFAKEIIKRGLHKKNCYFGFNTRFEYLDEETIKLLGEANFRFVLIGLESGSNYTLEKLKKGYTKETVLETLKLLTKYGLHPHLTIMVGYYWEDQKMLDETISFVKKIMFDGLSKIDGIKINDPEGAFYFFPDISHFLGKQYNGEMIHTATDLCMYILNTVYVSMVTGEAFGDDNCIRISYAAADEKLIEACKRIKIALDRLS